MAFQLGPSPLEAFQVGSQLRGPTALGQFAQGLTQRLLSLSEKRQGLRMETDEKIRAAGPIAEAEARAKAKYPDPWTKMAGDMMEGGQGNQGNKDYFVDSFSSAGPTFKSVSGIASESAGRYSMFDEGSRQAPRARKALFPTGRPESLRRDLLRAVQFRQFGGTAIPFDPAGTNSAAQQLDYQLERLAESQLRMETGAAAPTPEDIKKQKQVYMNMAADPQALYQRLLDIERSLITAKTALDPHGRLSPYVQRATEGIGRPTPFELNEQGLPKDSQELP